VKDLFLEDERADFFPDLDQGISHLSFRNAKGKVIRAFHEQYIQSLLRESNGNISKAAELAGIQRQYLHRLMKEEGIDAEGFKQKNQGPGKSPNTITSISSADHLSRGT